MHLNAQDWAVAAIVTAAALYALWYWLPASLRRRLGAVRPALAKKPGCGSCSSCGGCGSGSKSSNAPADLASDSAGAAAQQGAERTPVWMVPER